MPVTTYNGSCIWKTTAQINGRRDWTQSVRGYEMIYKKKSHRLYLYRCTTPYKDKRNPIEIRQRRRFKFLLIFLNALYIYNNFTKYWFVFFEKWWSCVQHCVKRKDGADMSKLIGKDKKKQQIMTQWTRGRKPFDSNSFVILSSKTKNKFKHLKRKF